RRVLERRGPRRRRRLLLLRRTESRAGPPGSALVQRATLLLRAGIRSQGRATAHVAPRRERLDQPMEALAEGAKHSYGLQPSARCAAAFRERDHPQLRQRRPQRRRCLAIALLWDRA